MQNSKDDEDVKKKAYEKATSFYCGSYIDDMGLSVSAFRILFHLQRRAGSNNVAKCGLTDITKVCRLHRETAVEAVHELEKYKLIECERRKGRATLYSICSRDKFAKQPVSETDQSEIDTGVVSETDKLPDPNQSEIDTAPVSETDQTSRKEILEGITLKENPSKVTTTTEERSEVSGEVEPKEVVVVDSLNGNGDGKEEEVTPEKEKAEMVARLVDERVARKRARELVAVYPEFIRDQVDHLHYLRSIGKPPNEPARWLSTAIQENYALPEGLIRKKIDAARQRETIERTTAQMKEWEEYDKANPPAAPGHASAHFAAMRQKLGTSPTFEWEEKKRKEHEKDMEELRLKHQIAKGRRSY